MNRCCDNRYCVHLSDYDAGYEDGKSAGLRLSKESQTKARILMGLLHEKFNEDVARALVNLVPGAPAAVDKILTAFGV